MTIIRTVDEPLVSGDEVLVAVMAGERRLLLRIACAAVRHLAGRAIGPDEDLVAVVAFHWVTIAAIVEEKAHPGFTQIRVTLEDVQKPVRAV